MPEEQVKEPEVKEAVAEKVTDAQLDSASELFEEVEVQKQEEVKPVEVKEVVKTQEELDQEEEHRERSRLGRRLKKMEEERERDRRIEVERWERLERILSKGVSRETPPEEQLPEIISTPEDVEKVVEMRERKQREKWENFNTSYLKTARAAGIEDPPEVQEEVLKMITSEGPFSKFKTGIPEVDAELNYSKAKAAVLSKKIASPVKEPKVNVKGQTQTSPTNLTVVSKSEPSRGPEIQLDDDAKDFLRRIGKDEKWAADALSRR